MTVRLNKGAVFENKFGDWLKIEIIHGNQIAYNRKGCTQKTGVLLNCTKGKFRTLIRLGKYKRKIIPKQRYCSECYWNGRRDGYCSEANKQIKPGQKACKKIIRRSS